MGYGESKSISSNLMHSHSALATFEIRIHFVAEQFGTENITVVLFLKPYVKRLHTIYKEQIKHARRCKILSRI